MIFITVGTEKYPFNRLVKIIDTAIMQGMITEDVFGQIGTATYIPTRYNYKRYLPYDDMTRMIKKSTIIVSHAGIGTIISCLKINKIPILFPRSSDFNEHVDNHQVEFMNGMIKRGKLLWAKNGEDLIDKILKYREDKYDIGEEVLLDDEKNLIVYLRNLI